MLTVLFATFNGERTLPDMLDSFCHINVPKSGWKIIIVDNASTDKSAEIIHSYKDKLPISYYLETKKGKNNALNTGLAYVEGELIVFTDDDIIADKDWLIELETAALNNPDYDLFGGAIRPRWPIEPKEIHLLPAIKRTCFAITDTDLATGATIPGLIWGPNMAIRSFIFKEKGFVYNPSIGPDGSETYAMGSESAMLQTLYFAGHKSFHQASAIVQHNIRANQMQKAWLLKRAIRSGKGTISLDALEPGGIDFKKLQAIAGVPRYLLTAIPKHFIYMLFYKLAKNETQSFLQHWLYNRMIGRLVMYRLFFKQK